MSAPSSANRPARSLSEAGAHGLDALLELPPTRDLPQNGGQSDLLRDALRIGLPSAQAEAWRWSGVARLLPKQPFHAAPPESAAPKSANGARRSAKIQEKNEFALYNGRPSKKTGREDGLLPWVRQSEVGMQTDRASGEEARKGEETPFPLLARALAPRTLRLKAAPAQDTQEALEAVQLVRLYGSGDALATHAAMEIHLDENARLNCLLDTRALDGAARLVNSDLTVTLKAGARLQLLLSENENPSCFRTARVRLLLGEGARATVLQIHGGYAFSRTELEADLAAHDSEVAVAGIHALAPERRAETILRIRHRTPRTRSRATFRAAVGDEAEHGFQGRVTIAKHASDSDAAMESKSLLLGKNARSRNKPELEIFHDQVACSHGVAISEPDPDALFYLRSRGLSENAARRFVIAGFLRGAMPQLQGTALADRAESAFMQMTGAPARGA